MDVSNHFNFTPSFAKQRISTLAAGLFPIEKVLGDTRFFHVRWTPVVMMVVVVGVSERVAKQNAYRWTRNSL
jgi:hypothetical protein